MTLARTLREVNIAANPAKALPSGDPRYVSATAVRGNEDVVQRMFRYIDLAEDDEYTTQLFTGHRGSGKSTELLRLKTRLEKAGYAVMYFEADHDLDINDVEYSDIILTIVRFVMVEMYNRNLALADSLLENVLNWFADTLYESDEWREVKRSIEGEAALGVGLPDNLPLIARLLARVTGQIHSGTQVKNKIRRQLDPQISQLIAQTNNLLQAAQQKLKKPLVLLIDNLDRITLLEKGENRTNHDAIYIEKGEQLASLQAHTIYTVPISLLYSPRAPVLTSIFPEYAVLPMIKNRQRHSNEPDAEGMAVLRQILAARIDISHIFTEDAVNYLCRMSGGHPRDLMVLVRYAVRYAPETYPQPIDLAVAQRAVGNLLAEYSRAIPDDHYPLLAKIHLDKTISNDAAHRLMLYNQSVLEYYNGSPPWHDVHPVVLELPKFQTALTEERQQRAPITRSTG